jgi:hypothetical protein
MQAPEPESDENQNMAAASKPAGFSATVVTTKLCTLLTATAADLQRFGSVVADGLQLAAWHHREALLSQIKRLSETNAHLEEKCQLSRQFSGVPGHSRSSTANAVR